MNLENNATWQCKTDCSIKLQLLSVCQNIKRLDRGKYFTSKSACGDDIKIQLNLDIRTVKKSSEIYMTKLLHAFNDAELLQFKPNSVFITAHLFSVQFFGCENN